MKFNDYLKARDIHEATVSEMATRAIKYKKEDGTEEVVHETRKTPIFFDQDDIDYLNQLPPKFWSEALYQRYGWLLYKAHEAREKGGRIPDKQTLKFKKGYEVPGVDTGINRLYDKLNADVDDEAYSSLDFDQSHRHAEISKEDKQGKYGFSFEGFKWSGDESGRGKAQNLGKAAGYVVPDLNSIRKRLKTWLKATEEGWHDEEIRNHIRGKVNTSGKIKNGKWTSTTQGRDSLYGKKEIPVESKTFTVEKRTKSGVDSATFEENIPILRPGFMISTSTKKRHDFWHGIEKQLDKDLEDNNLSPYRNLIDLDSENFLNNAELSKKEKELEEITKWLAENKKATNERRKKTLQRDEINRLIQTARYISSKKEKIENEYKILIPKIKDLSEEEQEKYIAEVIRKKIAAYHKSVKIKAKRIRDNAEKFNVDQFNIAHQKGRVDRASGTSNPHTKWTGLGTVNPNWQQKEKIHTRLLDIFDDSDQDLQKFWDHVNESLSVSSDIKSGISNRLQNEMNKSKNPYQKAIIYGLYENIDSKLLPNALIYFRDKASQDIIPIYAKAYKLKDGNRISKTGNKVKRFAYDQGSNYIKMVLQIFLRLESPQKWNRIIRYFNPQQDIVTIPQLLAQVYQNESQIDSLEEELNDIELNLGRSSHAGEALDKELEKRQKELETKLKQIKTTNVDFIDKEVGKFAQDAEEKEAKSKNIDTSEKGQKDGIFASALKWLRRNLRRKSRVRKSGPKKRTFDAGILGNLFKKLN